MNAHAQRRLDPRGKIALHSQFADYLAGERVYPVNIEISPSGVCQATCDFCFYAGGAAGSHRAVFLRPEALLELLNQCADLDIKSVTWTGGGEPTLHPHFASAVAYCDTQTSLEQGLFTNALARPKYNPQHLRWIRVTMTDKPWQIDYIKPLRSCKTLGFAFNYKGSTDDAYLHETLRLAEAVQADYVQVRPALDFAGKTVDITPPSFTHPLLHVTDYKFAEAKKRHSYATCEAYHLNPFIWEDGSVDTCAYMRPYPGHTLGNIYIEKLKDILDRAPPSVPVHENCQVCCKLNEMNIAIHEARTLEDKNFP